MNKKTQLALFVTTICSAYAFANQPATLEAVEVVASTDTAATISKETDSTATTQRPQRSAVKPT